MYLYLYHPSIKPNKYIENLFKIQKTEKKENYNVSDSIYKRSGYIDNDGCYNPVFRICNRKYNKQGYEIFTPIQNGCIYPNDSFNEFDTAFSLVDTYLNNIPAINNSDIDVEIKDIKEKCINKPSVINGLYNFGLCNKTKLEERIKLLEDQKNNIVDLNPGISNDDIQTGIDNTQLILDTCYPK